MAAEVQTTPTMSSTEHAAHGAPASATAHGHDDHGHAADTLGPIDWKMWGAGVLGVVAALEVLVGVVVATGFSFIR
jgi:hypothetical protein